MLLTEYDDKAHRFHLVDCLVRHGASASTAENLTGISRDYCLKRIKALSGRGFGDRGVRSPESHFDRHDRLRDGSIAIQAYNEIGNACDFVQKVLTTYECYMLLTDKPILTINQVYELILLVQRGVIVETLCSDCNAKFLSMNGRELCPTCTELSNITCCACDNIIPQRASHLDPRGKRRVFCDSCKPYNSRPSDVCIHDEESTATSRVS